MSVVILLKDQGLFAELKKENIKESLLIFIKNVQTKT